MKKTLEQVLIEQAEQMEKSAEAIRQIVAKSKDAGIVWPELKYIRTDYKVIPAQAGCNKCVFFDGVHCDVHDDDSFDCASGIFVKA